MYERFKLLVKVDPNSRPVAVDFGTREDRIRVARALQFGAFVEMPGRRRLKALALGIANETDVFVGRFDGLLQSTGQMPRYAPIPKRDAFYKLVILFQSGRASVEHFTDPTERCIRAAAVAERPSIVSGGPIERITLLDLATLPMPYDKTSVSNMTADAKLAVLALDEVKAGRPPSAQLTLAVGALGATEAEEVTSQPVAPSLPPNSEMCKPVVVRADSHPPNTGLLELEGSGERVALRAGTESSDLFQLEVSAEAKAEAVSVGSGSSELEQSGEAFVLEAGSESSDLPELEESGQGARSETGPESGMFLEVESAQEQKQRPYVVRTRPGWRSLHLKKTGNQRSHRTDRQDLKWKQWKSRRRGRPSVPD